jgi:hypothetical protein
MIDYIKPTSAAAFISKGNQIHTVDMFRDEEVEKVW